MKSLRQLSKAARASELIWRYGFNLGPSLNYAARAKTDIGPTVSRIVADLDRNGIAITSIGDLFENGDEFDQIAEKTDVILSQRADEIFQLEANARSEGPIGQKTFNMELLGSELIFDPTDVFARFAINPLMISVANGYLRMSVRLRYYNVWYTFASETEARESQLWHFDREDNYILKAFVYLRDVDQGTGPFTYAPGTHRRGKLWNRQPEYSLEENVRRSTDSQMDAVVPRSKWITATGKKGTIVFADTRGFHKGGEARENNRLMYTCMYTSPASDSRDLIRLPKDLDLSSLSAHQQTVLKPV